MKQLFKMLAVTAAVLGLGACATAPDTSALLTDARETVTRAEGNPNVTKYSAAELQRARNLLLNAEGAAKEHGANHKVTAHYAYLAAQTARIAEQRANEQLATARMKAGETERQQILLAARESEANRALASARSAQAEANRARNEALNAQSQMAQAQAESERLAAQLEEMEAAQTSRGIVLTLDDVLFDTGKSDLKPGSHRVLDQLAAFLNDNPERRVQVEGFTDSQGSDEYNQQLSQNRADAVATAIVQRGIAAERVRALGYGEEFPVASNGSPGSRQLNRRVEVIVSNGDGAIPGRTAQSGGQ